MTAMRTEPDRSIAGRLQALQRQPVHHPRSAHSETFMNAFRITAVAAAIAIASFTAFADDPTPDTYRFEIPDLPRAAVVAARDAARADGSIAALTGEDSGSVWLAAHQAPSTLSREAVIAEVLAERAAGLLDAMLAEDSGSFLLAQRVRPAPLLLAKRRP
jgi:hypothetical protein